MADDLGVYSVFDRSGRPRCWFCGQGAPIINDRWCCKRCRAAGERMLRDDPAPEQIRKRCREIRRRWTQAERLRRAGLPAELAERLLHARSWTAPIVAESDLPFDVHAGDATAE